MNRLFFILLLVPILFLACGKGGTEIVSGGTETETSFIRGNLVSTNSTKKAGAIVHLYSTEYISIDIAKLPNFSSVDSVHGSCDSVITDENGFFLFDSVASGLYNIMTVDTSVNEGVFFQDIKKVPGAYLDVGTLAMTKNGRISVSGVKGQYAYAKGTGIFLENGLDGNLTINNIPPGNYSLTFLWFAPTDSGSPWIKNIPDIIVFKDSTTMVKP